MKKLLLSCMAIALALTFVSANPVLAGNKRVEIMKTFKKRAEKEKMGSNMGGIDTLKVNTSNTAGSGTSSDSGSQSGGTDSGSAK